MGTTVDILDDVYVYILIHSKLKATKNELVGIESGFFIFIF